MSRLRTSIPIVLTLAGCGVTQPNSVVPTPELHTSNKHVTQPVTPEASPAADPLALSSDVLKRAKDATVLIGDFEGGKLSSTGSGVVAEDGLTVLTNRHVVVGEDEKPDDLKLVFFSGTDHPRLVKVDAADVTVFDGKPPTKEKYHQRDVASIRLKAKVAEPLKLGQSESEEETRPAWAIGFPHGTQIRMDADLPSPTVHSLRIERLEKKDGIVRVIQLGGSPTYGDSGGPVIDASGSVVGLMQAKDVGAPIVFAVPTAVIVNLLAQKKPAKLVAMEWAEPLRPKDGVAEHNSPSKALPRGEHPVSLGRSVLAGVSVDASTLDRLSPMELTVLRNEPFARRGYIFKRAELNRAFRATDWYVPTTQSLSAVQRRLSAMENRNVEFIRAYQEANGKQW